MKPPTLGFIGGGRITKIILQAFKHKSLDFKTVVVFEPDKKTSELLKKQFPEIQIADSLATTAVQEIVFLAVHPPVIMETLEKISTAISENTILISLAPKISLDKMASVIPSKKLVRMIPNATSYMGKGYNPVSFYKSILPEEKVFLFDLLKALGKTFEVDEIKLEGYAIISAMLPTYFWFQWKKMEDIAMQTGFTEAESKKIIRATLSRSLKLYYKSELSPEEVIDLIPVKPIKEYENEIENIFQTNLMGLYNKIKP